jgi:tRNA A37 threonylcarbamoyladenosine biosynthesis protein TsaE
MDLGLQESLDDDGVLLVEWGDAVEGLLPQDHLVVELTVPGDGEMRSIAISAVGSGWSTRAERLEQAVDRWRVS